jgi:superfamily I DNA and/or RNA helicase
LPAELRAALPRQGIVNLAEARAVVQALEALAAEAARSSSREAQAAPAVAVISLFPAQVELLRLLIHRSAALAGAPLRIEVGLPSAFHQREASVVLIALTRSHVSRAVPFSDSPQALLLALTRPAARLVLFGDPGTLARRSQWYGGLDHLDEAAGPMEQSLIAHLLIHLTEPDHPARAARPRESSSV